MTAGLRRGARLSGQLVIALLLLPISSGFAAAAEAQPAAGAASDYIIGAGDTLKVFVLQNPDLSTEVPVRPDGKITTPLVNDIVAVGKTAAILSKDIETALAEYVRSPTVNVIVTRAAGTFAQIRIVGQAATPKALPFRSGMTVLDAVIEVGGLSQYAAGNRAQLIRTDANGKVTRKRIRLQNLLNDGDISQNLPLQPGDVLVIPEARF